MIKDALMYLMDLADNPAVEDSTGEREWIKGGYTEIVPPIADPVRFYSLTSFVEFVNMAEERDYVFVQVKSPTQVELVSMLDDRKKRTVYATANPLIDNTFEKSRWMGQDVFVTSLQAFFADTKERAALLKVAGTIRSHDTTTLEDDGTSQQVATAAGIASQALETIPNPVTLQPYETFPEIEQPFRDYIVRFRGGEQGEFIQLALFEVPDPKSSFNTCVLITEWLQENLPNAIILG